MQQKRIKPDILSRLQSFIQVAHVTRDINWIANVTKA